MKNLWFLLIAVLCVAPAGAQDAGSYDRETLLAVQEALGPDFIVQFPTQASVPWWSPDSMLGEFNLDEIGLTGTRLEITIPPNYQFSWTHEKQKHATSRVAVFATVTKHRYYTGGPIEVFLGTADEVLTSGRCTLTSLRFVPLDTIEKQFAFVMRSYQPATPGEPVEFDQYPWGP